MLTAQQIRDVLRHRGPANDDPHYTDRVLTDRVIEFIQHDALGIETADDIALRRRALERHQF